MPDFTARPELTRLAPYNAGLTLDDVRAMNGGGPIAKLGSNENPHPIATGVREAIAAAADGANYYPDPSARALADALSGMSDIPASSFIFGNGSEDLLNILCRAILRDGDEVITLYPSFPLHEDYANMMGARVTQVPLTAAHRIDMEALLDAVARPHRLTLLSNPSNPTGLWLTPEELAAVMGAQHRDSALCLDEAYAEYAVGSEYVSGLDLLSSHSKPLLVLRTFSKAYGLANLRIGYGASNTPGLLSAMNLVRTPFNVNGLAQAAALAALDNRDHVISAVCATLAERDRLADALKTMGIEALPSNGNFLFFDCGTDAQTAARRLLDKGVIVKPWKQPGFDHFIRVSVGVPHENAQFLNALPACLA